MYTPTNSLVFYIQLDNSYETNFIVKQCVLCNYLDNFNVYKH